MLLPRYSQDVGILGHLICEGMEELSCVSSDVVCVICYETKRLMSVAIMY